MRHDPPVRLRDDPHAPAQVREDFERAREAPGPAYDAARGLAALEAAIAAGPAPAAPPAASGAAGAKSLATAIGKGAFWGLVAIGAASVALTRLDDHGAAAARRSVASASPAALESAAPPPGSSQPPTPPTPPTSAETPEPPAPAVRPAARRPAPAPSAEATAAAPPVDGLHQEVEHLARVRELEPSNPAEALAMAEEGHRRFHGGVLRQEREALAIDALVKLGRRGEAQVRARAFVAAYPRSPLVERIERRVGE